MSRILPPLTRTARDAEAFARVVHAGQVDKAGEPYYYHLHRVAADAMFLVPEDAPWRDEAEQIAWLHDVIEDTKHTASDLREEGFSLAVVSSVQTLTRTREFSYQDWIEDLAEDTLPVILVKLADNLDNANPRRLALLDEKTRERLKRKYGASIPILREAAIKRGWVAPSRAECPGLWPDVEVADV
jgi:(p)ppGpp synthase/HD superfamily hydrolase